MLGDCVRCCDGAAGLQQGAAQHGKWGKDGIAALGSREDAHAACFLWLGRVRFGARRCGLSDPSSSQSRMKSSSSELPGSARLLCAAVLSRPLRRRGGDSGASLATLLLRLPLQRLSWLDVTQGAATRLSDTGTAKAAFAAVGRFCFLRMMWFPKKSH